MDYTPTLKDAVGGGMDDSFDEPAEEEQEEGGELSLPFDQQHFRFKPAHPPSGSS